MAPFHLIHSTELEEGSTYIVQGKFQFYGALNKCIGDPKRLLIKSKMSVVGLPGMGGAGKTVVPLDLCSDNHIKGSFSNSLIFITVSQVPNLKRISETTWEKIAGKKRQEFQNLEDGHMQLQQPILMLPKATLAILDDVWSRVNLENLLFEGLGYKSVVKTIDTSTIPTTQTTRLYQLPLLCRKDALSLSCFWAFRRTSIPCTVDTNLVKEVHIECDGLPLVLKVIGSSLNEEPYAVWERAKDKISKEEYISDFQKKGLVRYMEINIDSLDHIAKECFLDLGLLVEDRVISVNALLDIWVYAWKLQWHNSFVILSEPASTDQLNLTGTTGATISHGNVSELYFSQHNVMGELPLYLRYHDTVVQGKRFLMPRKEHTLLGNCKLYNDRAFDAQHLSIHRGLMEEGHLLR
ncbi:probable disease resistance protein At4g33300 isoform X2 [Cryptomeria japonica]|uniref:probable disease resistance protein At4g33300 isoform X2 n=1 Tax=Cryptomeria japonica TaxID=3369 RepID=UPI0027D9EB9A|nr:probable disease resistance protein At4g33300 isoform X2 [Cryptomeria japonica]